jgi:hypothetical protein
MSMSDLITRRVHYFDRQYLRQPDFADEQAYQIALRRRHNIAQHIWGIVSGLEITVEEQSLGIRPGMAIDGYGREIVLAARYPVAVEQFQRLGSNRLDVWLNYDRADGGTNPSGYLACSGDAPNEYYRTAEIPRVALERAGASRVDTRRPKLVPTAVLDAPLELDTPDDPLLLWPVYLGRVTWAPEAESGKQFLIDLSDRPYAGVVGDVVDHPANPSRIEIGKLPAALDRRTIDETTYLYGKDEKRAFAIFVPPEQTQTGEVQLDPRFEIGTDGVNRLRGNTTVNGNLSMAGGAVQFPTPAVVDDKVMRQNPSIYRTKTGPQGKQVDELRIDLGDIAQNPVLIVGYTKDDGSFVPALEIKFPVPTAGGAIQPLVTIYGDLTVKGLLTSADSVSKAISSEALQALLGSFQSGVAAASGNR